MSEPERFAASTMTTPSDRPEISRLRRGKSRARLPAERHFGQGQSAAQNVIKEVGVLRRINPILAAGENRNRTGRCAGTVRGRIDAAREARCNAKSGLAKPACKPLSDFHASG